MEIKEEDNGIWVQDSTGARIHFSHAEEAIAIAFTLYLYSCKYTYDRDLLFQSASKHCKKCFCNDALEFSHVLDHIRGLSPQEIPNVLKCWKMDYRHLLAIKICVDEIILDPVHYVFKMEEAISKSRKFVNNSLLSFTNRNYRVYMTPDALAIKKDSENFVKICINTLRSLIEGDLCTTKTK